MGRLIGALEKPTVIIQEGGYATKSLGVHARHFFRGLWEASTGRPLRQLMSPSAGAKVLRATLPPPPRVPTEIPQGERGNGEL
jgi:hypothetical protein